MTNEERHIAVLNRMLESMDVYDSIQPTTERKKAIKAAIKALEQQPCEDWYDVPSDEMTLEQARQAVKDLRKKLTEYLEQEPCDDAISREELLKAIYTWDKFGCDADTKLVRYQDHYIPYIHYDDVIKCIKDMPSVTPTCEEREKGECPYYAG